MQRLRDQLGRTVYPAHRLDRATSGVLLFALSAEIRSALGAAFEAGAVAKRYLAIVRGWPPAACSIDHPLRRLAADGTAVGHGAQSAVTALATLATTELAVRVDRYPAARYALVALAPASGRRHQLRRHLKHASHPIIGDTTYGQGRHNRLFRERFACGRLLLHAWQIGFRHPADGRPLSITAVPPTDFATVATALGWPASCWEDRA